MYLFVETSSVRYATCDFPNSEKREERRKTAYESKAKEDHQVKSTPRSCSSIQQSEGKQFSGHDESGIYRRRLEEASDIWRIVCNVSGGANPPDRRKRTIDSSKAFVVLYDVACLCHLMQICTLVKASCVINTGLRMIDATEMKTVYPPVLISRLEKMFIELRDTEKEKSGRLFGQDQIAVKVRAYIELKVVFLLFMSVCLSN